MRLAHWVGILCVGLCVAWVYPASAQTCSNSGMVAQLGSICDGTSCLDPGLIHEDGTSTFIPFLEDIAVQGIQAGDAVCYDIAGTFAVNIVLAGTGGTPPPPSDVLDIDSDVDGDLVVDDHITIRLLNGATVNGNAIVDSGHLVMIEGSTITGNVTLLNDGCLGVSDDSLIKGNIKGSDSAVAIEDSTVEGHIRDHKGPMTVNISTSTILGDIHYTKAGGTLRVNSSTVDGNILTKGHHKGNDTMANALAEAEIVGNLINGNLTIYAEDVNIQNNAVSGNMMVHFFTGTVAGNVVDGHSAICPEPF